MIRRDSLKLLCIGIGAGGAALWPVAVLAGGGEVRAVFDGRFALARDFAAGFVRAEDCAVDAAALWYSSFRQQLRLGTAVLGLTTPADAMIFADCARRERLTFRALESAKLPATLTAWEIR